MTRVSQTSTAAKKTTNALPAPMSDTDLQRLLREAGIPVALEVVERWTGAQQRDAEEYARAIVVAQGRRPAFLPPAEPCEVPDPAPDSGERIVRATIPAVFLGLWAKDVQEIGNLASDAVIAYEAAVEWAEPRLGSGQPFDTDALRETLDVARGYDLGARRMIRELQKDIERQAAEARGSL